LVCNNFEVSYFFGAQMNRWR